MVTVKTLAVIQNFIFTFFSLHIINFYTPYIQVIKELFLVCLHKTQNIMKEWKDSDRPKQTPLPDMY